MTFDVQLSDDNYVAFVGERQCQMDCVATCQMDFEPKAQESAGMALVQAMNHQLHIERALSNGKQVLRAVVVTADYDLPPYFPGFKSVTNSKVVAEVPCDAKSIVLQLEIHGEEFIVKYGEDENNLTKLCDVDGGIINPEKVGCMTGTMIGMYASGNGEDVDNEAQFDWFELKNL